MPLIAKIHAKVKCHCRPNASDCGPATLLMTGTRARGLPFAPAKHRARRWCVELRLPILSRRAGCDPVLRRPKHQHRRVEIDCLLPVQRRVRIENAAAADHHEQTTLIQCMICTASDAGKSFTQAAAQAPEL